MPVLSCRPGTWRVTYGWGAQYSFGTDVSHGEPLSLAGTSRASLTPFPKLCGAIPLLWGWTQPPSLLDVEGPTSAAILANFWIREDPGDLTFSLQPLQLPLPPSSSLGERCTSRGCPKCGTPPLAHPWHYLCPHHLKWSSNKSKIMVGFLQLHMVFFILMLMDSWF